MPTQYNDSYPSCSNTYATLRIYHDNLDPSRITRVLDIEPSQVQVKGQVVTGNYSRVFTPPIGGWFLTTEDMVVSKDLRRHVDWILERLTGKDELLKNLQAEGNWMDIFCLWLSTEGHGGPTLSPSIMRRLAELELEIGFDLYVP